MENKILSQIKSEEVVQLLSDFVSTPSISGDEARLAEKIAHICDGLGMETTIDRHGNVIALLKGKKPGPRIAFNSHMDTVGYGEGWTRDPLGAEIEGDKLYGRGSADCKGSMVGHILATKALIEAGVDFAGEIAITHVVEEEVQDANRKGTVKLLKDGFKADMAINGEAIDMNLGVAGEGMAEIKITTTGKRAHGSTPKEGVNAINHMCQIIAELNQAQPGFNRFTGEGSIVPGVIQGGEMSSVVPDVCELKVSRFLVPGENGSMFYSLVQGIIDKLSGQDENFRAAAELTYESKPHLIDEKEPVVQHFLNAHKFLQVPTKISGTPQHCDADFLVNLGGIPTVIYGPGKIKVGHIPDEYVEISEVIRATKVYALALHYGLVE